ncbi:hypothetical protein GCM10028791_43170 [Echinicola sediminis]
MIMKSGITHLVDLWKEGYSNHLKENKPYQAVEQLKHIAALFSPGEFFYFIMNMHNLKLEYVHPSIQNFIEVDPDTANIEELLTLIDADDMESVQKKEATLRDFMDRGVNPEELPFYKMMYMYRMKDKVGKYRTMLLQANVLSVSEEGTIEHILSVHTDVSFLGVVKSDTVSFINLRGGKSFFDINPENGEVNFDDMDSGEIGELLTNRELEIIQLSSKGYSVEKIAKYLNISALTVRTHRKNTFKKTKYTSMGELVAKCLMEGLI